jgi:hypothetical protein
VNHDEAIDAIACAQEIGESLKEEMLKNLASADTRTVNVELATI